MIGLGEHRQHPSASPVPAASLDVVIPAPARSLDAARYQVLERRDVRTAVEFELIFVPIFVAAELLVFGVGNPPFAFAAALALLAFGGLYVGWRVGLRRRPHSTAFAIGVVVFAMGIVAASTSEIVASLMNGFFAVVVIGCAVWMPWSPRWHAAFLAMALATLLFGLAISPLSAVQLQAALLVGFGAVIVSGVGYWLVRRRHLLMWGQTIELRRGKAELRRTIRELEDAEHRVRRLEGILPICASCKRIRDGSAWTSVEGYVSERTDALFSHGICPDCMARLYPDDASLAARV